jgi:hypothetical protein
MEKRLQLENELIEILGTDNVIFQASGSTRLTYPCILYSRAGFATKQADNHNYVIQQKYEITVIYKDPDETISKRILEHFKLCSPGRTYKADNLYHDTLTLYY